MSATEPDLDEDRDTDYDFQSRSARKVSASDADVEFNRERLPIDVNNSLTKGMVEESEDPRLNGAASDDRFIIRNPNNHSVSEHISKLETPENTSKQIKQRKTRGRKSKNKENIQFSYEQTPPSSSTYLAPPGHLYNSEGMLKDEELVDVCDCLRDDCVGCHFPCRFCRSCKCGNECRQNRRWLIECAEIEGTNTVLYNKHLHLVRNTHK